MSGTTSKGYPAELRERAVRVVGEIRADHDSEWAAMSKVAEPMIAAAHASNYGVYGARKIWLTLNRERATGAADRSVHRGAAHG